MTMRCGCSGPEKARQGGGEAARNPPARPRARPSAHTGNQANLRRLQAKLTVGAVNDPLEHEADAAADKVMRMADPGISHAAAPTLSRKASGDAIAGQPAPPLVDSVIASPGRKLDPATHDFMAAGFGADFNDVRIHTDARAARSAAAVGARAYTVGSDIAFGAGEYDPSASGGQRLLAHELAHVVQQRGAAARPVVRRVLAAYSSSHSELLPDLGMDPDESASVTSVTSTADSARIRTALSTLIAAGKIEVTSIGDRDFYSLPTSGAATSYEVQAALLSAGFVRSVEMTTALMDRHNAKLFAGEELYQLHGLWTQTISRERNVILQTDRPLTSEERAEASLVFGPGLNYSAIRITEDPVLGAGQTARTLPSGVNFPVGASSHSRYMPWLIHELTHSWQYQHGRSVAATGATAILCWAGVRSYDYGLKPALVAAAAAGRGLSSFNTEQQGDIARDYYNDLKAGNSVSEYAPFLREFRTPP